MRIKKRFSILTKVGIFYLLFTLASFIISALILQREADWHMHHVLERRFRGMENWITRLIAQKPEKIEHIDFARVQKVDSLPENTEPTYRDTVMMHHETQQREIHRIRTSYVTVDEQPYRVRLVKSAEELYRFRDDIFEVILPVFGVLAVLIIISNYLLSGYLFKPFKRILKQMADYRIGGNKQRKYKPSSTHEFYRLQQIFERMQQRIEDDYFQLKEYTENMSHELQTPLSIIRNKAEQLIAEEELSQSQADKLKAIYDESRQLSKLGSMLNLITKIENQEFVDVQEIKTASVIPEHVEKLEEFAAMRELTIKTDLEEAHTFTMDPGLLDILLRNLLKNALHYAQPGTTIWLRTDIPILEVCNYGPAGEFSGQEIFRRFKRGKNSTSLGLGLAIVDKICRVSSLTIAYTYENGWHWFTVKPR